MSDGTCRYFRHQVSESGPSITRMVVSFGGKGIGEQSPNAAGEEQLDGRSVSQALQSPKDKADELSAVW